MVQQAVKNEKKVEEIEMTKDVIITRVGEPADEDEVLDIADVTTDLASNGIEIEEFHPFYTDGAPPPSGSQES